MTKLHARHYASSMLVEVDAHLDREPSGVPWICPSFCDLQINGGGGSSFVSPQLSLFQIRAIADRCRRHGIGTFLPTLITASHESLASCFKLLVQALEDDGVVASMVPYFHLEGPFISPEDGPRGAHPREHVRLPDWEEFLRLQEAANGRIRLVTLAPELPGAIALIEKLVASGIVVAIGHTAAPGPILKQAKQAGAKLSTHLGNGCAALIHRHDNHLWEQLADDDLIASLICDGHHLPPAVVKCFVRMKGTRRIVLVSDASSLAGLPPRQYHHWEQDIEITEDKKIVVKASGYLAGSWVYTDSCVAGVLRMGGVSFREAIEMASSQPRRLIGLPPETEDWIVIEWQPEGELNVLGRLTGLPAACLSRKQTT